jgi:membrane protease YdiL (CAAX protease family)
VTPEETPSLLELNGPYRLQLPAPGPYLGFTRAFWTIAIGIAVSQVFNLILLWSYDFDTVTFASDYHLKAHIGGLVWYIALTGIVLAQIKDQGLVPSQLFNFEMPRLQAQVKRLLKYFGGAALAVILLHFAMPGAELGVAHQTIALRVMTFVMVVIVAPVCEEIIFRGYLYNAMRRTFKREREREVVNALLFAAAHVFLISYLFGAGIPYYIFVLGYLLARLYSRSGSVLPGIVLHALNNGLVFALEALSLGGHLTY